MLALARQKVTSRRSLPGPQTWYAVQQSRNAQLRSVYVIAALTESVGTSPAVSTSLFPCVMILKINLLCMGRAEAHDTEGEIPRVRRKHGFFTRRQLIVCRIF